MSRQKVVDSMITGTVTASKLSGALPAINGANLTGVSDGVTRNSNDPSVSTNPSGGVGTVWVNTTSGEMYVCTDATAGENIWTNVGPGTGDVPPFHGIGNISGFTAAGYGGAPLAYKTTIDKYSFSSDSNAIDHGDVSGAKNNLAGHSSTTHGFVSGGEPNNNVIEKFAFAGSNVSTTDVGDLSEPKYAVAGCSSTTHGYVCGGRNPSSTDLNTIENFSFATTNSAQDVGDMTVPGRGAGATHSTTHGYVCGGIDSGNTNTIDKFSFASNANATDTADLTAARHGIDTHCTETHGYCSGGHQGGSPGFVNIIDNFNFSTGTNAADVGDLTIAKYFASGTSSETHGYSAGGYSGSYNDIIEKFSFVTGGNAVDSNGNLTSINYGCGSGSLQY